MAIFFSRWGQNLNIFVCYFKAILLVVAACTLSSCDGMEDVNRTDFSEEMRDALNDTEALNEKAVSLTDEMAPFNSALKAAVDAAPSVQSLRQAERAFASQLIALESQNKPQMTSNARAGVVRYDNSTSETASGLALNVLLSQLVYDGGFVASSIGSAEAQLSLAKSKTFEEKNRVAKEAASSWLTLWEAQEIFSLFAGIDEEIKNYKEQAKRMSDVGLVDRSVLDSVERRLLTFELKRSDAESSMRSAQMAYARYFKNLPEQIEYPDFPITYENAKFQFDDKTITPTIKTAALQLIIDKKNVEVKRARFFPQVFYEVGVSSPISNSDDANLSGGVNVRYTIMDGGKRAAELSAAEENVISKQHTLNAVRQEVEVMSKLLREQYDNSLTSETMVRKSVLGAKERLMVAESQLQTGKSNIVELVEARYQYVLSEVDLIKKTADIGRARLDIVELLGLYEG